MYLQQTKTFNKPAGFWPIRAREIIYAVIPFNFESALSNFSSWSVDSSGSSKEEYVDALSDPAGGSTLE